MITAIYTGGDLKKQAMGTEKQISAMLSSLPEGTTVTVGKKVSPESMADWLIRAYPNGYMGLVDEDGDDMCVHGDGGRNGEKINGVHHYEISNFLRWRSQTRASKKLWSAYNSEHINIVSENDHYHIVSPDGYNGWFDCSVWTIMQKDAPKGRKAKTEPAAVNTRRVEAERPVHAPVSPAVVPVAEPSAIAWAKDHLVVSVVSDRTMVKEETVATLSISENTARVPDPVDPRRDNRKEILSSLMGINGVTIHNSRECVWVGGNTYPVRYALKERGFRWAPSKKAWWKYVSETVEA